MNTSHDLSVSFRCRISYNLVVICPFDTVDTRNQSHWNGSLGLLSEWYFRKSRARLFRFAGTLVPVPRAFTFRNFFSKFCRFLVTFQLGWTTKIFCLFFGLLPACIQLVFFEKPNLFFETDWLQQMYCVSNILSHIFFSYRNVGVRPEAFSQPNPLCQWRCRLRDLLVIFSFVGGWRVTLFLFR